MGSNDSDSPSSTPDIVGRRWLADGHASVPSSIVDGSAVDPAPFVAALRENDPVCWLPGLDGWIVTRHVDVRRLFVDPRVSADPRVFERYRAPSDPRSARWSSELPFRSSTPDGQSPGRKLVSAALSARAVARMETCVRDVVERFSAPLRGRVGVVDLMAEFAGPVAAIALGRILGVPPVDRDEIRFRKLAARASSTVNPFLSEKRRLKSEQAAAEMGEYILALVEDRRAMPGDDFTSDLLSISDGTAPETADFIARVLSNLVAVGTETTSVACVRALRLLLRHPDELARLSKDRSLLRNAVEELLRLDSGVIAMPRYALEDFEMGGRNIRKGQSVILCLLSANRDPRVFSEPDRLDLGRDTQNALVFGFGTHYCVGANIARLELRLMIEAALDFLPNVACLVENEIRWTGSGLLSQPKSLPVDFGR